MVLGIRFINLRPCGIYKEKKRGFKKAKKVRSIEIFCLVHFMALFHMIFISQRLLNPAHSNSRNLLIIGSMSVT